MTAINLNKKQKLVYDVIQEFPEAANNDAVLLEKVWLREGWDESKSLYWNLSRVSRAETITRRRRELYNLKLITYSTDALERREEAYINEKVHAAVSWLD